MMMMMMMMAGTSISGCQKQHLINFALTWHLSSTPQITTMKNPVPLEKRVAITLYKLASNMEFHDVANLFGVGISTDIFWEVCKALCQIRNKYVTRPKNEADMQAIIGVFESKTGFPMMAHTSPSLHLQHTTTVKVGTVCCFKALKTASTRSLTSMLAGQENAMMLSCLNVLSSSKSLRMDLMNNEKD